MAMAAFVAPVFSIAQSADLDIDGSLLPKNIKVKTFVHYPREDNAAGPDKNPALPAPCVSTTNDQVATYGLAGWHLTGAKTYKLNERTVPTSVGAQAAYAAINSSWASWSAADAAIAVSSAGNTALSRAKFDGTNLIAWGKVPNNAIGVTYTWYNSLTGEQVESDTIFNSRLKWSYAPYSTDCGGAAGTYDVENIAVHEFGHWVGLGDLYGNNEKDLTMYGYGVMTELKKDTLGAGDILGAQTITP